MPSPWIAILSTILFMAVLLYALPNLSRRTQWFAVTVEPTFRETAEGRAICRRYRLGVTVAAAVAFCCVALLIAAEKYQLVVVAPGLLIAGWMLAFASARQATLAHAVPVSPLRVASLKPRSEALPGAWLIWAGPFLILAAASTYTWLHWDQIPQRFPTHWGFSGKPDGWAERTLGGVYEPLLHGLITCGLLVLMSWQIASNSRGSAKTRAFTSRILVLTGYAMACLFGWLTARLPLAQSPDVVPVFVLSITFPIVIVGASLLFASRREYPEAPADADTTADRHWRGGLIYYNPDDPALFVEKRVGIGYDLNFGNRLSWVLMGVVALLPLITFIVRK